jgi:hypothetical protein
MKKLNTSINKNKKQIMAGLLALGVCLVVFFVFLGGIWLATKKGDSTIDNDSGNISSTDANVSSSGTNTDYVSVLNLTQDGELDTSRFYHNLQGKQLDYIYYGVNSNTYYEVNSDETALTTKSNPHKNTPIKWRILSTSDTKYSNQGGLNQALLWSDYILLNEAYVNKTSYTYLDGENSNYAFWGTSYIRAKLNGGNYMTNLDANSSAYKNATMTGKIAASDSYLYSFFSTQEQNSILKTKDYNTIDFRSNYDSDYYLWDQITNIIKSSENTNSDAGGGYYVKGLLDKKVASYYVSSDTAVSDTSNVIETTNDSLFMLDYLDINNPDYGFDMHPKS